MIITKTIKAGIIGLTNFKKDCLDFEYEGFQWWMIFGIDRGIYSTYKKGKGWKFKTVTYKEYPLSLWANLNKEPFTEIKINNNKLSKYWIKIRTKKKRGGIWCAFSTRQKIPDNAKLKDSFLLKNKYKNYELRLIYEYNINKIKSYSNILAIDLGERNIATVCGSFNNFRPYFYGRNIRGIRRHYSWLRKRLGNKKLIKKIKEISDKEKRIIEQELHKISNNIIKSSVDNKAVIVLGNLKGIRKSAKNKGRRFNRIVGTMPYYKLTQMITYKASLNGIKVIRITERNTSKTCSKCGSIGKRLYQGLFKCNKCIYEINADYNASKNILKSSLDYMSSGGVIGLNPKISSLIS